MSDIFISYSSKDRIWIEKFVKVLTSHGWSVWWDRDIPTGQTFDMEIERALEKSKCVIVVWSRNAVASKWVRSEAAHALERNILLPVRIDNSKLPLEFQRLQTQSLIDWNERNSHRGLERLVQDIGVLLKTPTSRVLAARKHWWMLTHPLWLMIIPAMLASTLMIVLWMWPVSARVQVEVTTERVEFKIGATEEGRTVLGGLDVRSLAIEKFAKVVFDPDISAPNNFKVADPSQYRVKTDDFPESAWKPLTVTSSRVALIAKDQARHPRVTVEGLSGDGKGTIHLAPITVREGTQVTLQTHGGKHRGITIKVTGQQIINLSIGEPVRLIADHSELHGLSTFPFQKNDELTYRVKLSKKAPSIEIAAQPDGPVLSPTFASGDSDITVFTGIPVSTLEFTRQASEVDGKANNASVTAGQQVSALIGEGMITFPDFPHLGRVPLKQGEAIGLGRLNQFTIERITLLPENGGMNLVGYGMASQVRTRRSQIEIDHNLNKLEDLWHNAQLTLLFTIMTAVFTTILGAYNLWKEFKR